MKGDNGAFKYNGNQTISIEMDEHMSHDELKSRVCSILNLQSDLVKLEFIVKFDPTSRILLCNNVSFESMLKRTEIYYSVYVSSIGRVSFDYPKPLM